MPKKIGNLAGNSGKSYKDKKKDEICRNEKKESIRKDGIKARKGTLPACFCFVNDLECPFLSWTI